MKHYTEWFSDKAVIVGFPDLDVHSLPLLAQEIQEGFPMAQVRNGMSHIIIESRHCDVNLIDRVAEHINNITLTNIETLKKVNTHTIHVDYSGLDLSSLSTLLGTSQENIIAAHQKILWEVAMTGFAPGFGYLIPKETGASFWGNIPRLTVPREKVPAGSVAVASGMSAIYPKAMPGGWHILGYTQVELFDARKLDPILFHPGDIVKFEEMG